MQENIKKKVTLSPTVQPLPALIWGKQLAVSSFCVCRCACEFLHKEAHRTQHLITLFHVLRPGQLSPSKRTNLYHLKWLHRVWFHGCAESQLSIALLMPFKLNVVLLEFISL